MPGGGGGAPAVASRSAWRRGSIAGRSGFVSKSLTDQGLSGTLQIVLLLAFFLLAFALPRMTSMPIEEEQAREPQGRLGRVGSRGLMSKKPLVPARLLSSTYDDCRIAGLAASMDTVSMPTSEPGSLATKHQLIGFRRSAPRRRNVKV